MIFYRDSFGGVFSDLRFPGSVGHPAGAAVVRTWAGDRKIGVGVHGPLNPAGKLNRRPVGCKVNKFFTATATAL